MQYESSELNDILNIESFQKKLAPFEHFILDRKSIH